ETYRTSDVRRNRYLLAFSLFFRFRYRLAVAARWRNGLVRERLRIVSVSRGSCFPKGACTMNSRNLTGALFALTIVRGLQRTLCPMLLAAAFLIGRCQPVLAQYEALDLVPEHPAAAAPPAGGVTLFQDVRIFDGKN